MFSILLNSFLFHQKNIGWNPLNYFHDPCHLKNSVLEFNSPGIFLINAYFSLFKYSGKWGKVFSWPSFPYHFNILGKIQCPGIFYFFDPIPVMLELPGLNTCRSLTKSIYLKYKLEVLTVIMERNSISFTFS